MYSTFFIVILTSFNICSSDARSVPSYFTKCSLSKGSINECILQNMKNTLPRIVKNGDTEFKLGNMNPMLIKSADIDAGPETHTALTNVELGDFNTVTFKDVRFDIANKKFSMTFDMGVILTKAKYNLTGSLMGAPASGHGDFFTECTKCLVIYNADLTKSAKHDRNVYKVENERCTITANHCKYNLDNIFGGDKLRSDETNKLINDNWSAFFDASSPSLNAILSKEISGVINSYLTQIDEKDLFEV